jgi:peptide/nickel transport system substrate-binding protein
VTATAFKRAIERTLDPRTQSYASVFVDDIVGLPAFQGGRAKHIAGVVADGNTLTVRLTAPSPSLPARLATTYFSAVPPDTPVDRSGVEGIASAGPYFAAAAHADGAVVLKRNPNYGGHRPAALSEIDVTPPATEPQKTEIADVEEGRTDALILSPKEGELSRLEARYGPQSAAARAGAQRFFSYPSLSLHYLALNTRRRLFSSARMRRAVSYAIDRRALAGGPLLGSSGQPTDQYLPPGMRGFRNAAIYPLGRPDVAKARRLASGRGGRAVMWTCNGSVCKRNAEIVRADLQSIGIDVVIRQFSDERLFGEKLPRGGGSWDIADARWFDDYADPFATMNFLFDPTVKNNIDFGGFDDPRFEGQMRAAAGLSGPRRYRVYGRLDTDLARHDPPVAAYANETNDFLFSARMGCEIDQPVYQIDIAALCVRP